MNQPRVTPTPTAQPPRNVAHEARECDVCGNHYDKSFEVRLGDRTHTFDCFECAIHELAPRCAHCQCRVIGHGTEANGVFYCCAHCARSGGISSASDRVDGNGQ